MPIAAIRNVVSSPSCSQSEYLAVPTRPAARPPNACDSAVRCGTAVSGTFDSGTPIADADDDRDDDPRVVDDLGMEKRADDGGRHAGDAGGDAAPRGLWIAQPPQRQDEERRGREVACLGEVLGARS